MFCPKCKYEYCKEITFCQKCQVDLVVELPQNSYIDLFNPVRIKFVSDKNDAELVMNLLRSNDILCFSKCREAGDWLKICWGFSVFGEDIYVDKDDCEKALELLEFLAAEPEPTDEENADMEYPSRFYRKLRTAIRIVFFADACTAVLYLLISFIMQAKTL